jgi:hypothetical protein
MVMQTLPVFHTTFNIAPYNTFVEEIIDESKNQACGRYVCVANVHMLIEAYGMSISRSRLEMQML